MTPSNLELARSIFADWERGEFGSADWAHPEIEFSIADGPAAGTWRRRAGMAEGMREFLKAWEGWRVTLDELRELDDGRVVAFTRFEGRGKSSGLDIGEMGRGGVVVFDINGGQVRRLVGYGRGQQALAELGL